MGTRSRIGIKVDKSDIEHICRNWNNNVNKYAKEDVIHLDPNDFEEGSIISVYCYRDGDLEGLGFNLSFNFENKVDVLDLIAQGDLSRVDGTEIISYLRWHGKVCPPKMSEDENVFANFAYRTGADYTHLYDVNDESLWFMYELSDDDDENF